MVPETSNPRPGRNTPYDLRPLPDRSRGTQLKKPTSVTTKSTSDRGKTKVKTPRAQESSSDVEGTKPTRNSKRIQEKMSKVIGPPKIK